jgi:hypothetical protein
MGVTASFFGGGKKVRGARVGKEWDEDIFRTGGKV